MRKREGERERDGEGERMERGYEEDQLDGDMMKISMMGGGGGYERLKG